MTERYAAYAIGITNGFLSRDEVRAAENYNAIPGGKGKEYLVPLNMAPAGQTPPKDAPSEEAKAALLADTLRRMARMEADQLLRLAKKSDFAANYRVTLAHHRERLASALMPLLAVVAPAVRAAEIAEYWFSETAYRIDRITGPITVGLTKLLTDEYIDQRVTETAAVVLAGDDANDTDET